MNTTSDDTRKCLHNHIPPTYDLKTDSPASDQYYKDASSLTDEVLNKAERYLHHIVIAFIEYINIEHVECPRAAEEYYIELLMLGTFIRLYSDEAEELDEFQKDVLVSLAELRNEPGLDKQEIDKTRGILATLYLAPGTEDIEHFTTLSTDTVARLLHWLEAAGDFRQEVKRLKHWMSYLASLPPNRVSQFLKQAIAVSIWFEIRSDEVLGRYTTGVDRFLAEELQSHKWQEDYIFCGRKRIEYHLNMVGAEIMNRVYRDEFLKSRNRLILLPGCMRLNSESGCRAVNTGGNLRCTGCSPDCTVNRLAELGKTKGFTVLIVTHESSLLKDNEADDGAKTGIVGIACVLNLLSGGWKAKALGIPAQCVLLESCGCKKHWHPAGVPTDINLVRLMEIL